MRADLSNPMRTWPTAADWAQRCLSEFFAQVRLETERLSAGGTASRRPALAAHAVHGPVLPQASASARPRRVRCGMCAAAVCAACGVPFRATARSGSACLSARCATARRHSSRSRRCGCGPKPSCLSLVHAATLASGNGAHARSDRKRVGRPAKRTCYSSLRDVSAVSAAPLLRAHALRSMRSLHRWRVHWRAERHADWLLRLHSERDVPVMGRVPPRVRRDCVLTWLREP